MAPPKKQHHEKILDTRKLVLLIVIGLAIVILVPQFASFRGSFAAVTSLNPLLLVIALVFTGLSYPSAAGVYLSLSSKKLSFKRTLLISTAATFSSRLLPAGAGAIATNVRYLQKSGYQLATAGSLAALNNLTGVLGHFCVMGLLILITGTKLRDIVVVQLPSLAGIVIGGFFILVVLVIVFIPSWRRRAKAVASEIRREIGLLLRQPLRFVGALLCAMAITCCYGLALYFSAKAVGAPISVLGALLVLTVGLATASATPTPGGLGGAEAGLIAALVSIGVSADVAFAATIVYRLCTYWLPILPATWAFFRATAKGYI